MLTFHQLEVLVAVADAGSVGGAAAQLVVTQPAVSSSLHALERQLDCSLVTRAGRGIVLTEDGERIVRYARRILALVEEATASIEGADAAGAQTVRLGVVTAAAQHLVGQLLSSVAGLEPRLGVELEVGNRVRVWQLLNSRAVDIAVTGRPPSSGGFTPLARRANELVVVCRPGTVWADRVADATWLVREAGSGTRASAEEVIAHLGIDPPRVVIGSNAAIQTAAEAGVGIALLPREAVVAALASRQLSRIEAPGTPVNRPWFVVVRAGEPVSAAARRWLDHLLADPDGGFEALAA